MRSALWALAIIAVSLPGAKAYSQPLDAILARLESLERENSALRERVHRLESPKTLRPTNAAIGVPTRPTLISQPASAGSGASATAGRARSDDGWSGPYFGASFGGVVSRSQVTSADVYTAAFPGTPPTNLNGTYGFGTAGWSNGGGVTVDLFGGVNSRIGNLLVGLQIEGSLAQATVRTTGKRRYIYFDGSGPIGPVANDDFHPQVHARWMASGLARIGWLADMSTLIYGIGGWTVGGFEYRNVVDNLFFQPAESYLAHGPTVGVGIERKIERNWTFRAEYRFAHFLPTTESNSFFYSAGTTSQSFAAETRFEHQMHTVRLGLSRQFPTH